LVESSLLRVLILGVCILLRVWDQVMWVFYLSTQRHYSRYIYIYIYIYTVPPYSVDNLKQRHYSCIVCRETTNQWHEVRSESSGLSDASQKIMMRKAILAQIAPYHQNLHHGIHVVCINWCLNYKWRRLTSVMTFLLFIIINLCQIK
jgi:hypothetical protein